LSSKRKIDDFKTNTKEKIDYLHKTEDFGQQYAEKSVPLMILINTNEEIIEILLMTPS